MSDYQTIALAKTGDPNAIAILINQALQSKGVTAKVTRQHHHIQVVLVSEQLPDAQGSVRVVQNGLIRLQSPIIGSVTISGICRGQKKSGWTQTLVLQEFIPEPPKTPGLFHSQGNQDFVGVVPGVPTLPIHDL